jgi:aspartyl protease family protein
MTRIWVLVAALIAITALIVWLATGNGHATDSDQGTAWLAYSITITVVVLASVILQWRGTPTQGLLYALVWVGLGFLLVLGYSFRNDFGAVWSRVSGELNPAQPIARSSSEVVLRKSSDGHFYADVDVNGSSIRMLADTGASAIALSEEDAETAGIDVDQLDFIYSISTANGEAKAAQVKLDEVRVGSIVRNDVRAFVSRGLRGSLLGMSFFSTLSKVSFESDELVLKD